MAALQVQISNMNIVAKFRKFIFQYKLHNNHTLV
jgi:hypothetical protein